MRQATTVTLMELPTSLYLRSAARSVTQCAFTPTALPGVLHPPILSQLYAESQCGPEHGEQLGRSPVAEREVAGERERGREAHDAQYLPARPPTLIIDRPVPPSLIRPTGKSAGINLCQHKRQQHRWKECGGASPCVRGSTWG